VGREICRRGIVNIAMPQWAIPCDGALGPFSCHPIPMPVTSKARLSLDFLLTVTLVLCIVRLWLMPLPSSFWVDEMGTAFVVRHGANDPTLRAAPQVADSIYYALPKLVDRVAGESEAGYRLFSLLAMAGTLAAVAGIAARLIDPRAAWVAVFACMAFKQFNYEAADARPYALGSLVLSCALLLLIRWLDSGRLRDGVFFAATASLLWWVHLVFWPFYLLFVLYAGFRIFTGQTAVGWWPSLAVFAGVAAAVLPVAIRSVALLHQAGAHVVVPAPQFSDLSAELKIGAITAACTIGFLVSRYFRWPSPRLAASAASLLLIAGWWLIDPLTLYGFSRLTGNSVFVSRYMYLAVPGATLMAILVASLSVPPEHWKKVACGLGVAVLLFGGHWNHLWPAHHDSDWRSAAAALRQWTGATDVPVICPSPFIEARSPVWRPDYPLSGFLYAHLSLYRIGGHIYPFPFETSKQVETYARELSVEKLSHVSRFAIYGGDRSVIFWRGWLAQRPELSDWENRVLGQFGDVQIAVFSAPARLAVN
jgi:hypothetical protein